MWILEDFTPRGILSLGKVVETFTVPDGIARSWQTRPPTSPISNVTPISSPLTCEPSDNNRAYRALFFLILTYCIKDTNLQSTLRNYVPITQMYIFCPLTKLQNVDESRPLIVPHELLQPVEVPILEFNFNTRYNHKLYTLIQNTPYEQSPNTEEHNIIKALELLWPLPQTKHIIRLLATLITSSDIIHNVFPHGFFTDD